MAQTLRGMQKSLLIGVCVAFISTIIAATVGAVAGYFGGWRDRGLMWLVDLLLVIPSFILIAVITPSLPQSGRVLWLIVLLAVFGWLISSRIVRGLTMSLRNTIKDGIVVIHTTNQAGDLPSGSHQNRSGL